MRFGLRTTTPLLPRPVGSNNQTTGKWSQHLPHQPTRNLELVGWSWSDQPDKRKQQPDWRGWLQPGLSYFSSEFSVGWNLDMGRRNQFNHLSSITLIIDELYQKRWKFLKLYVIFQGQCHWRALNVSCINKYRIYLLHSCIFNTSIIFHLIFLRICKLGVLLNFSSNFAQLAAI